MDHARKLAELAQRGAEQEMDTERSDVLPNVSHANQGFGEEDEWPGLPNWAWICLGIIALVLYFANHRFS